MSYFVLVNRPFSCSVPFFEAFIVSVGFIAFLVLPFLLLLPFLFLEPF